MTRTWCWSVLAASLVAVVLVPAAQQQPTPPSFKTRVTMVPLDVRVVDRNGRPITDLRQADFTVEEDGVRQEIRHFSTQALTAAPTRPGDEPLMLRGATPDLKAQTRRVFLLLAGRGRMDGPSKELDALLDFARTRLLPQDQVALLAYNRATPFTTDHARIIRVLQRFKAAQTSIESKLAHHFTGLQAVYGSKNIPRFVQGEIDGIFSEPGGPGARTVLQAPITDAKRVAEDQRRTADELLRAEMIEQREFKGLPDFAAEATKERLDLSFDDYVAQQAELTHDLANLYAGINYLRYLDGEKHMVFVTPKGVALPRQEDNRSLAAVAADARIALDIIFTGGTVGPTPPRFVMTPSGSTLQMSPLPSGAAVFAQTAMTQDLRLMTELTGGQFTGFKSAASALEKLDTSTRFQYLLGYYPSNTTADGRLRKIAVKVNRPGVTVLYRRGYFANPQVAPLDRREFVTYLRINAAAAYAGTLPDVAIALQPPVVSRSPLRLLVKGTVQSPRFKFTEAGGRRKTTIDIAVFCADRSERLVGQLHRVVELDVPEAAFDRLQRGGIGIDVIVPVSSEPAFVKVIVYEYGADIIGSAMARLPPR